MKKNQINTLGLIVMVLMLTVSACRSGQLTSSSVDETRHIEKVYGDDMNRLTVSITPGQHHNYPTFAIWAEDVYGNRIQTLFVTRSIASGYYRYGQAEENKWLTESGEAVRPAALPYWLHKREGYDPDNAALPSMESPFPDAFTGATPPAAVQLDIVGLDEFPEIFRVLLEVNQAWDFNEYWHNNRFPGNADYKTSAQPSVVYAVTVNKAHGQGVYYMNPIGHGHYAGENGLLYTNLSTLTTALDIFKEIKLHYE